MDSQDNRRRPLHEVCVDIIYKNPCDGGVPYIIDKEVLPRLIRVTQGGIILALRGYNMRNDLLQESIRYHAKKGWSFSVSTATIIIQFNISYLIFFI